MKYPYTIFLAYNVDGQKVLEGTAKEVSKLVGTTPRTIINRITERGLKSSYINGYLIEQGEEVDLQRYIQDKRILAEERKKILKEEQELRAKQKEHDDYFKGMYNRLIYLGNTITSNRTYTLEYQLNILRGMGLDLNIKKHRDGDHLWYTLKNNNFVKGAI